MGLRTSPRETNPSHDMTSYLPSIAAVDAWSVAKAIDEGKVRHNRVKMVSRGTKERSAGQGRNALRKWCPAAEA